MSKLIRQTVTFKASPHAVYEALMDSRQHARFTQSAGRISRKVGGAISAFDGYITGANLELVPTRRSCSPGTAAIGPPATCPKSPSSSRPSPPAPG